MLSVRSTELLVHMMAIVTHPQRVQRIANCVIGHACLTTDVNEKKIQMQLPSQPFACLENNLRKRILVGLPIC